MAWGVALVLALAGAGCGRRDEPRRDPAIQPRPPVTPPNCPTSMGAPMVRISMPSQQSFCIDTREATQREYATFLREARVASQPATCAGNGTFRPAERSDTSVVGCPPGTFSPDATPDAPVTCVDACDARAFCAWSHKRLCGKVGGGTLGAGDMANPAADEWLYACTNGGATAFPYGDSYLAGRCHDAASPRGPGGFGVVSAEADGACRGTGPGFDAVVGMSGNAAEWVDGCAGSLCPARGGNFAERGEDVACRAAPMLVLRDGAPEGMGIRCCAD